MVGPDKQMEDHSTLAELRRDFIAAAALLLAVGLGTILIHHLPALQ